MEEFIPKILRGDKNALGSFVKIIQKDIFNLALRFLSVREDAEDATQEILVKIITNLGKFEGRSKVSTWAYRIAANHLLNVRRTRLEHHLDFKTFGEDISNGLQYANTDNPDDHILTEEIKIGCTLGMLTCLDRKLRISYILGDIFKLNSIEAAEIIDITPENHRKRLSSARHLLQNFMQSYCGLVNRGAACRCNKRISYAVAVGRVDKNNLKYITNNALMNSKMEIETLHSVSGVFKSISSLSPDPQKNSEIINILNNLKFI